MKALIKFLKGRIQIWKCTFGYHEEIYTEEDVGYYMGIFPTTKSITTCKHCSYKSECMTSKIF